MIKLKRKPQYLTQIDNINKPYGTCLITSACIGLLYVLEEDWQPTDVQIEDYFFRLCYNLNNSERQKLINTHGEWIFDYNSYTVLPIVQYIMNRELKKYNKKATVILDWYINYDEIIDNINKDLPVVIHGNFSSLTNGKITGHYVCDTGYKINSLDLNVYDPFGNAHTGYNNNGVITGIDVQYNWDKIFKKKDGDYTYGLRFNRGYNK